MTHSGERFSRCVHCRKTIRQRQTLGVWKHFHLDTKACFPYLPDSTEATPRATPDLPTTEGEN